MRSFWIFIEELLDICNCNVKSYRSAKMLEVKDGSIDHIYQSHLSFK